MTTRPSYNVDPDQLRRHAGRLATHADQLSSIGSALPGELGPLSLGVFSRFVAASLGTAMAETRGAFEHAASTLDKVSDGMGRAADEYQYADEGHAADLTGIGSSLGDEGDR
ncbi:WXG100 family type VII secretion target [Saccharomonospora amisosensis]|uniref:WXG100 family type VII secretion target n=1 Tax=Saccharomonospora amisosensis TaxID=1128677 RepID=A0A7X5ZP44_9PSEU|nr:WXG100 family type VII secretion target [Saccharomonospora amisosensis]NIJ10418.1 WXG100 family type VII secretion target [Saccharomonospora amisosensis]